MNVSRSLKHLVVIPCLLAVLCSGCRQASSAPSVPKAAQPAATAPAPAPGATAGQPAPTTGNPPEGIEGQLLPLEQRCALLQERYFRVKLELLRQDVLCYQRILNVIKNDNNAGWDQRIDKIQKANEDKQAGIVQAHGFLSSRDLHPEDCPDRDAILAKPTPKNIAEYDRMARKAATLQGELLGDTVQPHNWPE